MQYYRYSKHKYSEITQIIVFFSAYKSLSLSLITKQSFYLRRIATVVLYQTKTKAGRAVNVLFTALPAEYCVSSLSFSSVVCRNFSCRNRSKSQSDAPHR
ncbi:hypothetical protein, partial [Stomatobaculum longum]